MIPVVTIPVLRCADHECRERTVCARYTAAGNQPYVLSMRLYPMTHGSSCRDRIPLMAGESS